MLADMKTRTSASDAMTCSTKTPPASSASTTAPVAGNRGWAERCWELAKTLCCYVAALALAFALAQLH
jgi:hypothetical protein